MIYKDIKSELEILASREKGEFMFVYRKTDYLTVAVFLVNQRNLDDENIYHYYSKEENGCPPIDFESQVEFTKLSIDDVEITYGDIYDFRRVLKQRTWGKFKEIDKEVREDIYNGAEKIIGHNVSFCNKEYIPVGLAQDATDVMWILVNEDLDTEYTPCAAPMIPSTEDAEICAEFHENLKKNWDKIKKELDSLNERFDEVILIARYDINEDKLKRL